MHRLIVVCTTLVLLAAAVIHVWAAVTLTLDSRKARGPEGYGVRRWIQASVASRYMRLSGLVVLAFIAYHLAHFTLGTTQADNFKAQLAPYAMAADFHLLGFPVVAKGEAGQGELGTYLGQQRQRFPAGAFRMFFTSNHDENSWNGSEFERMGANHRAAFVLASTFEGAFPLVYSGQEASNAKRLRFFDKDTIAWGGASLAPFYATLATLKDATPALHNGAWGGTLEWLAHDGGARVVGYSRARAGSAVVVLANFGDAPRTVTWTGLTAPGRYRDAFSGEALDVMASGRVSVPAHGWRLLVRTAP